VEASLIGTQVLEVFTLESGYKC